MFTTSSSQRQGPREMSRQENAHQHEAANEWPHHRARTGKLAAIDHGSSHRQKTARRLFRAALHSAAIEGEGRRERAAECSKTRKLHQFDTAPPSSLTTADIAASRGFALRNLALATMPVNMDWRPTPNNTNTVLARPKLPAHARFDLGTGSEHGQVD